MSRVRETPEVAAGVRRMVRALGRRVGGEDPYDLAELLAVRAEAEAALVTAVQAQHAAGFSWTQIAEGLGVSRQTAHELYAERVSA